MRRENRKNKIYANRHPKIRTDTANFCMMVADVVTTDEKERIAIVKSAND